MPEKDLYQILGVPRSSTDKEIQRVYRKLARQFHPDVNKNNPAAERKFKELTAAYNVLSEPKKRKLYDEFGSIALDPGFDEAKAQQFRSFGGRPAQGYGAQGQGYAFDQGEYGSFGDIFEGLFGGMGAQRTSRKQPSRSAAPASEHKVAVNFREAVLGGEVEIALGADGTMKNLKVKIPPGSANGSKIKLAGKKTGLGQDVILIFDVKPDPVFRREGRNLLVSLPVKLSELVSGASVRVPTLQGEVNVHIPANSRSGQSLRVKGRGVPLKEGAGDLLVKLELASPDVVTEELKELAAKLDRFYSTDPRKGI